MRFPSAAFIGIPLAVAGVIGIEVVLAVIAPKLAPAPPFRLDGPVGEGEGRPVRLAWLGDSTGAGVGSSGPEAALPRMLARRLGGAFDLRVLAISGARVEDVVRAQLPRLGEVPPDVVVVGIGSNDVTHLTTPGEFRRNLDRLLAGVDLAGARAIVVLGIPAFGTVPRFAQPLRAISGWRARRLDREVRNAARRIGALYVDVAGHTGPAFAADPKRYYAADGFHPSDAGYALWVEALLPAARSAVAVRE